MLDDDIQFLGVSNTLNPRAVHPSGNSVTGFALHIEKNGNEAGFRMMFRKVNANAVVVGRKPPGTASYENDNSKAMFRCPVVSRSHAKFTFTDSGLLYLTDTSSHHGTFIRRPHELTARMIPTETPVQVYNSDVVTFGKSVGRNNEVVRPIVARVEMIYHTTSPTSRTPVKMTTSGRYGLRLGNSSEDDSSHSESSSEGNVSPSGSSDHESDIVEIAPPPRASVSTVLPSVNRAIRSLILPTDAPSAPIDLISPSPTSPFRNNDEGDREITEGRLQAFKDIFDFGSPKDTTEDLGSSVLQNKGKLPRRRPWNARSRFGPSMSRSRSNSPMDLATPSPRLSPAQILSPARGAPVAAVDNGSASHPSPLTLDLFSFSPDKVKEPAPQSSSSSMSLNDILHPPTTDNVPSSTVEQTVDLVSAATSFLSSLSAPGAGSSEEESAFAGHAEEEDAPFEFPFPEDPVPADGPSSSQVLSDVPPLNADNVEVADGPSADALTMAYGDVVMESFANPVGDALGYNMREEEDRQATDEQIFDEVHYGAPQNHSSKSMDFNFDMSPPETSKLAEIRAALSSLKERFIGPSSSNTAGGTEAAAENSSASGGDITTEVLEALKSANEKKIQEINEELLLMKTNITNLQAHQRKYKIRFNGNVTSMNAKLDHLSALSSKVSGLQTVLDELKANLDSRSPAPAPAPAEAETLTGDVEMLKTDVDVMRSDVEGVRLDIEEARSEMNVVKIDVDGLRSDLDVVQGDFEASRNDVDVVRADVDSLRIDVDAIRNDVDYVKDDYETLHGDVGVLQNDVGGVQNDVDSLRADFGDMRRDVDDLMGGQGMKGEIDDLKEDVGRLERAWDEWKMDVQVEPRHGGSENDLRSFRPRLGEMEESIELLGARISVHDERIKALQNPENGKNVELRGLIDEVVKIQESTTAELKALQAARAQAEDELKAIVAMRKEAQLVQAAQAETAATSSSWSDVPQAQSSSLKRKRADDCEDVGAESVNQSETETEARPNGEFAAPEFIAPVSTTVSATDGILVPSPKRARREGRARRVGTAVAQTATAITIGAVAAWTALAFS